MTEILFISFQYPPINVGGAIRPYMFSKYLPKFGIKPIVLCLDSDHQNEYNTDKTHQLISELPEEVIIKKVPIKPTKPSIINKFIQIYCSIGDNKYKRWKKNAQTTIDYIINQHDIKAIYFTAPPFSNGELAINAAKKYNLPLVLDMRDGWSKWCIAPYASIIHYQLTKLKERTYFKSAKSIITVTNVLKDVFIETHPNIRTNKFHVIPNGFDVTSEEIPEFLEAKKHNVDSEIKIGYIGAFYYNPTAEKSLLSSWWQKKPYRWFQYFPVHERWIYRSPYFFLKSMSKFITDNPNYKNRLKFIFIGTAQNWLLKMVEEFGLTNNFDNRGFIEHAKLSEATKDIDYFLATSVKVKDGLDYAIASKTFDYIKFKKPILAFVTEGSQKEFIKNSNTGLIFNPDQTELNSTKLKELFTKGCQLKVNTQYLESFTRYNTTKELSKIIFNSITTQH